MGQQKKQGNSLVLEASGAWIWVAVLQGVTRGQLWEVSLEMMGDRKGEKSWMTPAHLGKHLARASWYLRRRGFFGRVVLGGKH